MARAMPARTDSAMVVNGKCTVIPSSYPVTV